MKTSIRVILFHAIFFFLSVHSFSQTSWTGTISTDWSNPDNWTNGVPISTVDAIIGNASFTGSNQPEISTPGACKNLTVGGSVSANIFIAYITEVSGSITIYSNGKVTPADNNLSLSGDFINNGVFDGSHGGITIMGSDPSIIGGSTSSLAQLIIAKTNDATVTLTSNITDVSLLSIQSGILVTSTYSITQAGGGGILNIDGGATMKLGGTSTLPAFDTYSLNENSNVEYAGTTQFIDNSTTYGNLILSSAGNKNASVSFIAAGDFTLSAGTFTSSVTVTHYIGGNVLISGGTFDNTNITIDLDGTGSQSINSAAAFKNLTIKKASGLVSLLQNTRVNGILILTSGNIELNAYNLSISPGGSISGNTSASYIITNNSGTLKQFILNPETKIFPVGTSTDYLPATVALTPGSIADTFSVRVLNEVRYGGTSGALISSNIVNATWFIEEGTVGGSTAALSLQWPLSYELIGFNRSVCRVGHYTGGTWDYGSGSLSASGSGPYWVSRSNFTSFSPFSVGSMSALPVSLLNLSGENKGNMNVINWSTATEKNNDYFTVEKTKDGVTFETVNKVSGAGNSTGIRKYSTVDNNPFAGTTNYRLMQTDFNGTATYSRLVQVDNNKPANFTLDIVPNPNNGGNTSITINTNKNESVVIMVYDYTGKEVYSKTIIAEDNNGDINFVLPSDKLTNGVYVVTVASGVSIQSRKLIIK